MKWNSLFFPSLTIIKRTFILLAFGKKIIDSFGGQSITGGIYLFRYFQLRNFIVLSFWLKIIDLLEGQINDPSSWMILFVFLRFFPQLNY